MRTFRLGDHVRIKAGAFASFAGKIEGINQAKRLLKVVVEIFGRATPIKLKFRRSIKSPSRADSCRPDW